MGIGPTLGSLIYGKRSIALNRDAGFAHQMRHQPHAPRKQLRVETVISYYFIHTMETVAYLTRYGFRTGMAKLKSIHIFIQFAFIDTSWVVVSESVLYLRPMPMPMPMIARWIISS